MENECMSMLPEDVLMDFLSRIPAKSLLRFKSVSKYWYSLIQNPHFISLHRTSAQPYDCFYALRPPNYESPMYLVPNQTSIQDLDLSFAAPLSLRDVWPCGSCHGLMCLFKESSYSSIVICNPAIRDFRVLPQPPYEARRTGYLGFGFDPKSNDYKVLRVATLYESDLKPYHSYDDPCCSDVEYVTPVDHKIHVYGMSSNSWKEIVAVVPKDSLCPDLCRCVSLDGVFYWLGYNFSSNVPVTHTFCMSEELYGRIPFPDAFRLIIPADFLCVLKNSVALVQDLGYKLGAVHFDVWVMDEYRVKESWTKKYTIGPILAPCGILLGFQPNVEVFLIGCNTGHVVSCNLSTGDINEYNQLRGRPESEFVYRVLSYSESLISVKI